MAEFRIQVDLSALIPPTSALTADIFPNLSFAVREITERAEGTWKGFAAGNPLPSGKSIGIGTGEYLRSISHRDTGPFSGEVFSNLAYAESIEKGAPARDLHDLLHSSLKVRVSQKSGRRYLIIPFRHSTSGPNKMPESVRQWWQGKMASSITSVGERPVHSDMRGTIVPWHMVQNIKTRRLLMTPSREYEWGDRLRMGDLDALGVGGQQARRLQGMVNFRRPGKTGGSAHSQYLTFRTMSEGSPGWRTKARDGLWPARTVSEIYQPVAEDVFARAVEADVKAVLPAAD